jgi:hypothetical protein
MMACSATTQNCTFVAIDVAKLVHEVLVEPPTGRRQRWRIRNCQPDYETLRDRLRAVETPVLIGFEATGNYHRLATDSVMAELSKIVHADPRKLFDDNGTLLPIRQWPDDMAGAVASIEVDELFDGKGRGRKFIGYTKKVKFWDKNSGIEKAMKHLGLFAEDNKQRMGALANLPRDVLQAIVERLQGAGGGKLINGHATRV